ncbi:glycosyltransferase family 9 protein [Dyella tabacisoli]|uniref:Lipopolysaccharide heptosyltransferase family protein n=2 Tax=Dyella tabacisoli TaxID=2282381 RepID=A0A369UQ31_9GAMM|nr:lipopolysaccharide heptosyltransferase family protein [Dyella tabacisoli]
MALAQVPSSRAVQPALSPVVIRFGRLGDTVLLQPLLHKLHLRYGRPCRLLALGGWPPALYAGQRDVSRVITFRTQHRPLWMSPLRLRAALALRSMREAPFYICEPELRTQTKVRPMLALAGIPAEHCVFIENTPLQQDEHWADWLVRFAETTPAAFRQTHGQTIASVRAAPQLQASADERNHCDAWLYARGLNDSPLVLLQPANKRTMRWNGVRKGADDDKSWPVSRWAALARAIIDRLPGVRVLLCGAPAEARYLDSIQQAAAHAAVSVAAADLPLGRLRALLEVAHSMVSVDTGPAHLAAAMGCPLVVLFGARSPSQWAPRSARDSAVSVLGGLPSIHRVDEIETAQVVDAWHRLPLRR